MSKLFTPFIALLAIVSLSFARDSISVDRVDFNSLRDDWTQMEVQLSCAGNTSPEAKNVRFVENVKVRVYLAYKREGGADSGAPNFDYYTAEVEIIIMERGDDNNLYFYLPGMIVERDQLPVDPDYYYVEISIDGDEQSPQKTAMSRSIGSPAILDSFLSKANSEGAKNEHILMPVYYAPAAYLGRISDLPLFLRRDVRQ
jgi:hypothetical protein